jgi:hypothetical protein
MFLYLFQLNSSVTPGTGFPIAAPIIPLGPTKPMKEYPEFETPPSMTAFTQAAEWLVDKLAWHELGGPFYYPITEASVPGYFTIIKKPMDLETIEKRIKEKVYSMNFNAVIEDIKQIFFNCYTYNQDTSSISQQAEKFEVYILGEAIPYVKKLLEEAKVRAEANTDPNVEIHLSPIPLEVYKKCKTMIQRLLSHKASVWFREPVRPSFPHFYFYQFRLTLLL